MRCLSCTRSDAVETVFASTEIPDKYKTHCYECQENEISKKVQTTTESKWIPPPLPLTEKQKRLKADEERKKREEEEARQAQLEWKERNETIGWNILVHPPINYGGPGEKSMCFLPRIYTASINDVCHVHDPLPSEIKRERNLREKKRIMKEKRVCVCHDIS